MVDCAWKENPEPPFSLDTLSPRKPFFLANSQIEFGISLFKYLTDQSSIKLHNSSAGPFKNADSALLNEMGPSDLKISQSGLPQKNDRSKPGVPASSACFS